MTKIRGRARLAITALAGAMVLSSCASLNVDAIPMPGTNYRGGYDIIIEFANVLNLPQRAKVVMDGTKVGVVTKVALTSRGVDVTSRIDHDIVVQGNMHSAMQQATVLGDTYVALERAPGANSAAPLGPGGRIPIAQTTSPPQLEDTIASLANFIGSGSIQRAQNTLININRITPPRPEIREIATRAAADLSGLSNNMDNVDLWLKGLSGTADVMSRGTRSFQFWFSPVGIMGFHHEWILGHYLAPVLPALGTIYYNGYWLVPGLSAITDALEAFQHSKWAFDEEVPRWQRLVTDHFLPEHKYPAINITSIIGPDGKELSGKVQDVLRMIGATP
jgi:phospholipid/cholesterol/gamma-HCH transport system substrate-binding protein